MSERASREREAAERLATEALLWLAERPEEMAGFLGWSGAAPETVRARACDPAFLGFALDFVLLDEARARAFSLAAGFGPEEALRARAALPGGDAPHWS
ncbi:MAG: DUF3572 family protein [Rubrimonas sp.]|uniref:DUF3572 family protein n=1 Tax=Rubrimonas sp. TaxID=2036015 RepID=UPI002FDDED89